MVLGFGKLYLGGFFSYKNLPPPSFDVPLKLP